MNRVNVDISANVEGFVSGINQATDAVEKYNTETKKIADATGNFRKEFAAAKKEALNLAAAYRNLSAEEKNSQFGKEMAKQLEAAKQKASELLDIQGDMQQELRNLASDTATFDSLSQGVNVFMQTTSAALGVVAQFTGNEEDARKAVVMFTTAQSSLNAITQIQNALQKQSALMLGVTKVQSLAATAAENLSTAAKSKNIVVTKAATIAQAAFNKVAMMNPYVLLATAIIAVGAALYGLISWMDNAEEAEKREAEQAEKNKQAHEHQRDAMLNAASSASAMATDLQDLREQYLNTNKEVEKTSILEAAAKHFKSLGMECNNLHDAQKILVENGDKVIKLIDLQGEAAAINALKIERLSAVMKELMDTGMSLSQARILAREDSRYKALRGESQEIQKQTAELQKQLKITSKTFGSGHKGGSKKPTIDYDKGSLADLEAQLSKLQEKLKKKNMSLIDKQKTLSDIDNLKKQIDAKQIELGFKMPEPKDAEGTEAWYKNQIKKLEDKKVRLPLDAYVERQQLQDQIDNLQLKIKLETEGVTVNGNEDLSKALNDKYEHSISGIGKAIDALRNKMNDTDWVNWDGQGKSLSEYTDKIRALEKEQSMLQKVQDRLISSQSSFTESLNSTMEVLKGIHAIDNVVNSFENLSNALGENANAWDTFMAIIQVVESVIAGINTVTEVANLLTEKSAINKAADATAASSSATATAAKAAAETAATAPAVALTTANKALEASVLDLAAAQIFAAHAGIPFAGVGIASGLITEMLAAQAAAKATVQSMQAFTEGGIIKGSSYWGDRLLVRANAGEMILNNRQQKNLFDLLDTGAMPQNGGTNVQVTGVIRGTDIMLVQQNTSKVLRKTGTKISF